jgi:hypothetical protein
VLVGGCLKPNPDFIEDTEAGSGASMTSMSSDTQASCEMPTSQELTPIDLDPLTSSGVGSEDGNFTAGVDEVWYRFGATADFALATLFASVATELADPVGLCVFFECTNEIAGINQAYVQCPDATMTSSPGGLMGCCGQGEVSVQWTCIDGQPVGNVFLRAQAPASAGECTPFEVAYSLSGLM